MRYWLGLCCVWACYSIDQVYASNGFNSINTGGGLITNAQFTSEAAIGQAYGAGLHYYSAATFIHHAGFVQSTDTNVFSTYLAPASVMNVVATLASNGSGVQVSWTVSANSSLQAAGPLAFSGVTNSPFTTYRIYYERSDTSTSWPSPASAYFDVAVYAELGNYATTNIVLTSLAAGFDYRIAVAGVNSLGQVGPLVNIQGVLAIPPSFARVSVSINHGGGYATNDSYASVGAVGQGQGLGMHMACAYIHSAGFVQTYQPGDLVEFTRPAGVLDITVANAMEDVIDNSSEVLLNWTVTSSTASWAAGPLACVNTELPPFASYRIYYTQSDAHNRWPTSDDSYLEMMDGFVGLGNYATTNLLLTGLSPGTDYRLAIAGVNNAGVVGPLSNAHAMVRTAMFDINHAFVNESNGVVIEWSGPAAMDYDVIYAEGRGFAVTINSAWQLAATVQGNRFVDTGDLSSGRVAPAALSNGTMRFYRVAPVNAWVPSDDRDGIASSNVVAVAVRDLQAGNNIIGFPVMAFSNTMANVFGRNRLPAGSPNDSSTFNSTLFVYTNSVYGDSSPVQFSLVQGEGGTNYWRYTADGDNWVDANDMAAPLTNAVSLRLPSATNLLLAGLVRPFDDINLQRSVTMGNFNMITLEFPFPVKIREIPGLRQIQAYNNQVMADRIIIINNEVSPPVAKFVLYRRNDDRFMYIGGGSAEDHELMPGEAIAFRAYPTTTAQGVRPPLTLDFTPNAQVRARYPDPTTRLTNSLAARPTVNRPGVSMAGHSATISARINPHGQATTYWIRHSQTDAEAISSPALALAHANNSFQQITYTVHDLEPGKGYVIEVVASNRMGVARASTAVSVGCPTIIITNGLLPAITTGAGSNYQVQLGATGGDAPYTFDMISGELPKGLNLSTNGTISGNGSGPGRSFSVRVTDRNGCTGVWQGSIAGESQAALLLASDSFKYAPGGPLAGLGGSGTGWGSPWTLSVGQVGQWSIASINLSGASGYPNAGGHSAIISGLVPGSFGSVQRPFGVPVTTGTLFVAALVKHQHNYSSCHAGLSLYDGVLRVAYFGKNYGNYNFGIEAGGINQSSDIMMNAGAVNLIVLKYDFSTKTLKGQLYHPNMTVGTEPANWPITINNVHVQKIDGVRLVAGGAQSPGEVFFDELRISTSWSGLFVD